MTKIAVTHCDYSYLIGCEGRLAYRSKEDFVEFKKLTMNKTLVMGRTTYQECGNLKNRGILALSSSGNLFNGEPTAMQVNDLESYVLCGGERVYAAFLKDCDFVYIHYTEQEKLVCPLNPIYFPFEILQENFKCISHRKFGTFTQRIWKNKRLL